MQPLTEHDLSQVDGRTGFTVLEEATRIGPRNPRFTELRRWVKRGEAGSTTFVLEGERNLAEALDAGLQLLTVVVPESAVSDFAASPLRQRLPASVEIFLLRDDVFARLAPSVTPQPPLTFAKSPIAQLPGELSANDFVLVLFEIADPGNLGTLIRVADAMGAVCVVVVGGADPWRPKSVRSSAGSVLRVPLVCETVLSKVLCDLRTAGAKIVGTDVRQGLAHDSGVLKKPLALVLGSESQGLDHAIDAIDPLVDAWVRIKMVGDADSLNVAMAGTLLAYEASKSVSSG
ncbi:MAG: RNA methyltransferase [Acidimicrobiia bacterium]|nr:RNA methyltransferase [Acidimicrobiia bacterium]MCY4457668.1 RNA methyltransferase [Acidimicrobiaceae bacterium]